MADFSPRSRRTALFGASLLAGSALALLFPPPGLWPDRVPENAGLLARVFVGVPPWWVGTRLFSLAIGAALVASVLHGRISARFAEQTASRSEGARPPARAVEWLALLLAAAHAVAALGADGFGLAGETVFFAFLAVPAGLLALASPASASRWRRTRWKAGSASFALPALWIAFCGPRAWLSPRTADVVDCWLSIERLEQVALGQQRVLSDSAIPGFTNAYMMLEGAPFLDPLRLADIFPMVQALHLFWTVVCALLLAAIVRRLLGSRPAIVAQAVFLFSPFAMSFPYNPLPTFLGPLCTATLLLLLLAVHRGGSAAAFVAFGAVAGFSGRIPQITLAALLLSALALTSVLRSRRLSWAAVAAGGFSGFAALLPGFPTIATLQAAQQEFSTGRGSALAMVEILFGQRSPMLTMAAMQAGQAGAIEIPVGAALAPFAIVREPLRLWGDSLLDPLGASLAALGLALCLWRLRHDRTALAALALLAAASASALVASGDRVSHTRLAPAIVPVVVLAALGFEALQKGFFVAKRATAFTLVTAAAIVAGGVVVFERVNPAILPSSSLSISIEALARSIPEGEVIFLEHGGAYDLSWLHVGRITRALVDGPVSVRTIAEFRDHELAPGETSAKLYFWNPAIEGDAPVSHAVCRRWPTATLYRLTDEAGLFVAFAASVAATPWRPGLPPQRWTGVTCASSPEGFTVAAGKAGEAAPAAGPGG